jgi:Uma2 family endonuclease
MSAVPQFANEDDIQRLPEHVTGEILFGQLHTQPRPTSRHVGVETGIAAELRNPFGIGRGGPGGWVILVEPELHLSGHVLVPDLAGWRRERLPLLPDGHIDLNPDWIGEILSTATANKDRKIKLPLYGKLGVGHAWLVDPAAKTIEVLRYADGHWVLLGTFGDDDSMRAEPFAAVAIDLAPLWAW